jgi:C-terminal processing protease CtpA/Prc
VVPNGFDDDTAAKEWDKHWPEIGKAHSLILDLRENGGGSDSVGAHILATLSETPLSRLGLAFASIAFRAGSV